MLLLERCSVGYYLKKKWESEDRETELTELMMTNQQKDTRIQDLERRVNQLSRDTVRQKHVISLLELMLDLLEKRAMFLKKENLFCAKK